MNHAMRVWEKRKRKDLRFRDHEFLGFGYFTETLPQNSLQGDAGGACTPLGHANDSCFPRKWTNKSTNEWGGFYEWKRQTCVTVTFIKKPPAFKSLIYFVIPNDRFNSELARFKQPLVIKGLFTLSIDWPLWKGFQCIPSIFVTVHDIISLERTEI